MTVTVTIRPKTRTQIRGLPWAEHGGNYALLAACIGASRRGQVRYEARSFSVARNHTRTLIAALAQADLAYNAAVLDGPPSRKAAYPLRELDDEKAS